MSISRPHVSIIDSNPHSYPLSLINLPHLIFPNRETLPSLTVNKTISRWIIGKKNVSFQKYTHYEEKHFFLGHPEHLKWINMNVSHLNKIIEAVLVLAPL